MSGVEAVGFLLDSFSFLTSALEDKTVALPETVVLIRVV